MLFGEHAVVYNRPCIVAAVDRRVTVEVDLNQQRKIKISAPGVGVKDYERDLSVQGRTLQYGKVRPFTKGVEFIEAAIENFAQKYGLPSGLSITVKNSFSCRYGLGSSAAVSVCLIRALSELYSLNLSKKEAFNLAYKAVLDVQKVGSGFDVAAAVWGGTLYFWTGGKKIEPLKVKKLPLVIAYSGVKADTPIIVKNLKLQLKNQKLSLKMQKLFDSIAKIVEEAKTALLNQEWERLGILMNENQRLLQELGVSTEKLDKMCQAACQAGAYGAKLSGAGGGDCMIALVDPKKKKSVEQVLTAAGGTILVLKTGAEGVKIED